MKLITKTYSKDLPWLQLAFVSVLRHARENIEWTIICDHGERRSVEDAWNRARDSVRHVEACFQIFIHEVNEKWPEAKSLGSGYIQQQWVKMTAHRVMGPGFFINWDSDVIALRPFTSRSFMNPMDKPILWFTPFNDLIAGGDVEIHRLRQRYIKNVFQIPEAPFEWMRCMPIWLNGEILRVAEGRNEWTRTAILMKANEVGGLSEFNLIGQFSHAFFPDAYDLKNTTNSGPTWGGSIDSETAIVHQSWSYGGISDQVRAVAHGQ